tara:strand:- start:5254 stop:6273 length:1020 start_codon:yes stop_codon:yes gene_type:complete
MPYIGQGSDGFGIRRRYFFTASAGDTSLSGNDSNGLALKFTDGSLVDVYLNGVLLDPNSDYNTTTANTIGSLASLAANDFLEVIVYDVFAIGDAVSQSAGGTFASSISVTGNVTATEGMTSRSEDVFNNRRIQINASANDTDEGSFLLLNGTDSSSTDDGDDLIFEQDTLFLTDVKEDDFIVMEDNDTQGFLLLETHFKFKAEDNTVSTTDGLTITGAAEIGNIRTHTNFDAGASVDIKDLGNATGTVVLDLNENANFSITLTGNITLANPTSLTAGTSGSIFLTQDGTGSRTATFGNSFDFIGGTAPTLTTAASSVDRLDYIVLDSSNIHTVATLAYS